MGSRAARLAALLGVAASGVALLLWLRGGAGRALAPPALSESASTGSIAAGARPAASSDPEQALRRSADAPRRPAPQLPSGARGAFVRVVDADGAPAAAFAFEAHCVEPAREGRPEWLQSKAAALETDAQGFADLAPEFAKGESAVAAVLSSSVEPAYSLAPARLAREAFGASRDAAAIVVRSRRAVAKVRGLLVDAAHGEPLADYPLRIVSWTEPASQEPGENEALRPGHTPSARWWMTTDASGRFESEIALPPATVGLSTYEKVSADFDHAIGPDGLGIERRVAVEVGAIVLLDFDPPEGYARTDFLALLRRDARDGPVNVQEIATPRDAFAGQRGDANAAPVQAGPPCRVRLLHEQVDDPLPSFLLLESRDRRCSGTALVEALEPYATKPLRVEVGMRDALDVEVVWPAPDEAGRSMERLGVTLTPLEALAADPEAEPQVGQWIARQNGEARTRTVLVGFTAGRQRLSAGASTLPWDEVRPEPFETELELPRREPVVLEPRLLPPIALHRIEGVVRTRSGQPLDGEDGRAQLQDVDPWPSGRCEHVTWSGGEGHFVIRDVPEGTTTLNLYWTRGWFDREPKELRFDVPCGPIEIVVIDDVPQEELVARVIDPQAGGHIEYQVATRPAHLNDSRGFEPTSARELEDGRRAFELASGPYPAGTPIALVELAMEGYEQMWLTDRDIPPADAHGRRIVEFVPRRGWSARVQVVSGSGEHAQPLAGIVLRFDGVETPASDETGYLIHRAPTPPDELEIATPGWELVERGSYFGRGSVLVPSGRFTLEGGELTVEVRASRK